MYMATDSKKRTIDNSGIKTHYGTKNTSFSTNANPYAFRWGHVVVLAGWLQLSAVPTSESDVLVTYNDLIFRGNYTLMMYDQSAGDFCTTFISINTNQIRKGTWNMSGRQGHVLNFIGFAMADEA